MSNAFVNRHIGTDSAAQAQMLKHLGYDSIEHLIEAAIPESIHVDQFRAAGSSLLPEPATERETIAELRELASKNTLRRSLIGQGYYDTITPAVIKRNVLENPSWYTAYTPYQPEISQGRLEAIINFQTMVTDLTGLATANGSMLDESTSAVEAMLLARRSSKVDSNVFVVDTHVLAQTKSLIAGRVAAVGIEVVELDLAAGAELPEAFGVLIQYPGANGRIWDPSAVIEKAKAAGAITIVAADLLALTLIASPAELGADVAVGSSQRFGVPMGFGGPHAGYMAVRAGLERSMPGRLVGVSLDANGEPAYRLTLQAREQHIRRDKATSNICTAQVLLAVMAGMYAVYHGPEGLKEIATQVHERATALAAILRAGGVSVTHDNFFDTLHVSVPGKAAAIAAAAQAGGFLLNQVDADTLTISVDETTTPGEVEAVAGFFGADAAYQAVASAVPAKLVRTSTYLEHPVFNTHRSETSMMRYLKRLADFDYALDRGMIPLGSCTMKLNAATEMEAVTWPEFGGLHPFAPAEDVAGYVELIAQLEKWLVDLTGYNTVSLQPNAGSQGELAGLLAIRGYHLANGDTQRTVCLIPSSAHGTNAASAVLAGMSVVVVACDEVGNVDLDDLRVKIAEHGDTLAALMITYPSTHGVYEHAVPDITAAVHAAGGQVYVDGANLNAMTGFARFGDFGGDVSHLNLHKTFCIPHGGGGPGVGPVAAKAHLAPYLPSHFAIQNPHHVLVEGDTVSTVTHDGAQISAAPYGSPSILPISWAYVRMMGEQGIRDATASAVLAANYISKRLADYYPTLYTGDNGLVAHECILDLRPLTAETGVSVDDVAKRLVDFGFHAPTMSFPVAGTLMIEPTESEDLDEIERFINAMITIKAEADAVLAGQWPADDNPLHNAPHTAASIAGEWNHPYSREKAVYPFAEGLDAATRTMRVRSKYWAPVRRIDNAYGDRNLVCSCPPPEAFEN
ncbi:glycine dehydrogenase [Aurantimicrobium minutum]|uniref:aminomethyl-transferring glycine dehydrogenase n=1 Tax=Aurantimicrobium minutum TaxID=708131 RepID=UPI0024735376|nr:aminomethyl-transferring glycine dehydrogenase [Aurantimicrobium minutum]MDH6207040.1 glycine dehydrogenase [Aurantimicrobium minutum]MDH6424367.1 glycine dehydrogenase [Aurantimicrobium minutum]